MTNSAHFLWIHSFFWDTYIWMCFLEELKNKTSTLSWIKALLRPSNYQIKTEQLSSKHHAETLTTEQHPSSLSIRKWRRLKEKKRPRPDLNKGHRFFSILAAGFVQTRQMTCFIRRTCLWIVTLQSTDSTWADSTDAADGWMCFHDWFQFAQCLVSLPLPPSLLYHLFVFILSPSEG